MVITSVIDNTYSRSETRLENSGLSVIRTLTSALPVELSDQLEASHPELSKDLVQEGNQYKICETHIFELQSEAQQSSQTLASLLTNYMYLRSAYFKLQAIAICIRELQPLQKQDNLSHKL